MIRRLYQRAPFSFLWISLIILTALLSGLLATKRPWYCNIQGRVYFPAFSALTQGKFVRFKEPVLDSIELAGTWRSYPFDFYLYAPVPFEATESVVQKSSTTKPQPPGTLPQGSDGLFRHYLGTDSKGRDVTAGLLSGARVAVVVGFGAMCISSLIGLSIGAVSGFFGNRSLRLRRGLLWSLLLLGLPGFLYCWIILPQVFPENTDFSFYFLWSLALLGLASGVGLILSKLPFFNKFSSIPVDFITLRAIELFGALPPVILVLAAAKLPGVSQSNTVLIFLIALLSWTGTTRIVRGEMLRVREMDYITAARGLGFSAWRILFKHALPNCLRPALVAFAMGVGGSILLEAVLRFLGFGAAESVSWGSMLSEAQGANLTCWWLILPAGFITGFTVLALYQLGEALLSE
jgi:ABC-type dipeptide/oligopeptide/nickel transport system permease subunit